MKILLIEDRETRQNLFMEETKIELESHNDILNNFLGEDECTKLAEEILVDSFDFADYDVIISHKSAFGNDNTLIIEKLKNHCSLNNKVLVLFSGGVDESYYNNSSYELIVTNSKIFYSHNLEYFLESYREDKSNVLMLIYGKRYKLNIALNVLEKLSLFIQKNKDQEMINYKEIIASVQLNLLGNIGIMHKVEKDKFNKVEIANIFVLENIIKDYIKEGIEDD